MHILAYIVPDLPKATYAQIGTHTRPNTNEQPALTQASRKRR